MYLFKVIISLLSLSFTTSNYEDNMKFIEDREERPTTTWWGLLKYNV